MPRHRNTPWSCAGLPSPNITKLGTCWVAGTRKTSFSYLLSVKSALWELIKICWLVDKLRRLWHSGLVKICVESLKEMSRLGRGMSSVMAPHLYSQAAHSSDPQEAVAGAGGLVSWIFHDITTVQNISGLTETPVCSLIPTSRCMAFLGSKDP